MELESINPEIWQSTFKEVFAPYLKQEGDFFLLEISTKYKGSQFIELARELSDFFHILNAQFVDESWKLHVYTNLDFSDSRVRHCRYTFRLSYFRKYNEYVNVVMYTLGDKLWLNAKTSVGDNKTKAKSKFICIVNKIVFFEFKKKIFCYDSEVKKVAEYIDFIQVDIFSSTQINKLDFDFFESFIRK